MTACGYALERGAELSAGLEEFYGRNMPDADFSENSSSRSRSSTAAFARVYNERGEEFFEGEVSWSENDLVQATAQQPGARAWYVLDDDALEQPVARPKVARHRGACAPTRVDPAELPFPRRRVRAWRFASRPGSRTRSAACGSTSRRGSSARTDCSPQAPTSGGISTGGYASGLAAALVFGRIAAESALDGL